MAKYCMSDIHSDADSFKKMLKLISFTDTDVLYILGDLFDRGKQPVELYFEILKHPNIIILKGNHDAWLGQYIQEYYYRNRYSKKIRNPYYYNTFDILQERLTEVDILHLGEWLAGFPHYLETEVNDQHILMAHAQTAADMQMASAYFLFMGSKLDGEYLEHGIEGSISIIGHTPTDMIRYTLGEKQKHPNEIWVNKRKNVYAIDCGNGYRKEDRWRRLGCIRLDDMQCFYV